MGVTDLRTSLQNTLGSAYTLERELGGGGMSRVFVAEETAYGRRVVVKVLPPDIAAGVNAERFRREIQVAARLLHAHVVPVLTSGETNGVPYYTMPFVDGESLRHRISKSGPLAIGEAISVLRDVAKALAYAHEHGVVHRDIKPDNVLLSGGSASVADFGIAKAISAARSGDGLQTLTQIGTSIGTPAYMSPEQAAADPASNHRSDIYSFGCLAYEALAGRPPFVEATPQKLLAAQMSERPRPILELRPDTPQALADLVMRCLQKDADDRPQQSAEIIRVLETVTSGSGHSALPPVLLGGRGMLRRALWWYAGSLVAVLVLAQAAVVGIGLPDWVLPGAAIVMLLGLPVILFTGYVQSVAHRTLTATPGSRTGQNTMASLALRASPHLSWNRTARGGIYALSMFIVAVGVFMLLRAAGVGPFGSMLAAGQLGSTDQLLLADFRVVGGDSSLGATISEAVRSNISQSKVIRLLSPAAVSEALQRMRRGPGERLTLPLARELALRDGIPAVIDGEIVGVGGGFLVTIRLVTADSGLELAGFRKAAGRVTDLIPVVDALSLKLRGRIGESLKDVRASTPLAQATTSSLPALKKFSEAQRKTATADFRGAIDLLTEAIALDSNFALAHRNLAEALNNAGRDPARADAAIARAFALSERLPERERWIVTGEYYRASVGPSRSLRYARDRKRAQEAYAQAFALGDRSNTNSFSNILVDRREYGRADSITRLRLEVDPTHAMSHTNGAGYQLAAGHVSAAESTLALAKARGYASYWNFFVQEMRTLVARDSIERAGQIADSVRRRASGSQLSTAYRALAAVRLLQGQPRAAARLFGEMSRVDSARGVVLDGPALDTIRAVMRDAWFYSPSPAHAKRLEGLSLSGSDLLEAATAFAFVGRPDRSRALVARWRAETRDTAIMTREMPLLHSTLGEIALAEKKSRDALIEFRRSDTTFDGPVGSCDECVWANLARAYDMAGDVDSTIISLKKALRFLQTARVAEMGIVGAPFEKRLGELYEQQGDRRQAYEHYARFVRLWKDAEIELQPAVADVKRRMARLSDSERR